MYFSPESGGSHLTDKETENWKGVAVNPKWAEASLWSGQARQLDTQLWLVMGREKIPPMDPLEFLWWD